MKIREFSEKDIDEITNLMKSLCLMKGQKFNEERWRTSLEKQMKEDSSSEVFVAFEGETENVHGMAHCSIKTNPNNGLRFGYIYNLIVKEEKRRTGVGELLMRNIVDYFKRNRIQSIRLALKTNLENAAKILFTKLGFNEIFRVYEKEI